MKKELIQINFVKPKPFVKWAGGKSQLLQDLIKHSPNEFRRYLEPFVGGGALLFELNPRNAIINDSNEELINCYEIIRDYPEELIDSLKKHENDKDYFLKIRAANPLEMNRIERASRFIFLNRTCFNGLWRVNRSNQFNTPFGNYKNPTIVNPNLIFSVSLFLKNVKMSSLDFEEFLLKNAKEGDFIYLDPPYHPVSKYSDFKRYTKDFFGFEEQKKLAKLSFNLHKRGCKLLLSNSFSKDIIKLYNGFEVITVHARRNINKDPNGRGYVKEVLFKNYEY